MRGFIGFDAVINARGGVASRRELLDAGWTADELRIGFWYGRLDRVRRGWYGSADLPPLARAAWSGGGPLACLSALVHHGVIPADDPRIDPSVIHVALPAHAKRPTTLGRGAAGLIVVYHRGDDPTGGATRLAVSVSTARTQLARCRGHRRALA